MTFTEKGTLTSVILRDSCRSFTFIWALLSFQHHEPTDPFTPYDPNIDGPNKGTEIKKENVLKRYVMIIYRPKASLACQQLYNPVEETECIPNYEEIITVLLLSPIIHLLLNLPIYFLMTWPLMSEEMLTIYPYPHINQCKQIPFPPHQTILERNFNLKTPKDDEWPKYGRSNKSIIFHTSHYLSCYHNSDLWR